MASYGHFCTSAEGDSTKQSEHCAAYGHEYVHAHADLPVYVIHEGVDGLAPYSDGTIAVSTSADVHVAIELSPVPKSMPTHGPSFLAASCHGRLSPQLCAYSLPHTIFHSPYLSSKYGVPGPQRFHLLEIHWRLQVCADKISNGLPARVE